VCDLPATCVGAAELPPLMPREPSFSPPFVQIYLTPNKLRDIVLAVLAFTGLTPTRNIPATQYWNA
jgi:hypothetical protein